MLLTNDLAIEVEMVSKAKFPGTIRQSERPVLDECLATLGEIHDESAYGAIERLVEAGEAVGFSAHDLVRMLNGGMTLTSLLDLIEMRMSAPCFNAESTAA